MQNRSGKFSFQRLVGPGVRVGHAYGQMRRYIEKRTRPVHMQPVFQNMQLLSALHDHYLTFDRLQSDK